MFHETNLLNNKYILKKALLILLTFSLTSAYGQTQKSHELLDSAKSLFRSEKELNQEELDHFNYDQIVDLLKEAIAIEPANAEAHYLLGYAYSRINSRDGRSMTASNLGLTIKSSEQFEQVNKLSPRYTGEILILDPYSKITALWGSMAMSYRYQDKPDSAVWAFREGKRRGGFGDFVLDVNRKILDACSKDAILVSSGDNFTIPLWYLQMAEGYRKDVSVVDISLLNASWYPRFLVKQGVAQFDLPPATLDTMEYTTWPDSLITINGFSWTVKPSYYNQYLLRGDRLLLSLLRQNRFQRDLFFTIGFMKDAQLSLEDYLSPLIVVDRLDVKQKSSQPFDDYSRSMEEYLQLSKVLNRNSTDELRLFDYFRYNLLGKANELIQSGEKDKAAALIKMLDRIASEDAFPYQEEDGLKYLQYVRQNL